MNQAAAFMLLLAVFWLVFQFAVRAITCSYCGRKNEHEVNCPFNLEREERS